MAWAAANSSVVPPIPSVRGREDGSISEDALPAISRITELKPATDYTHGRFSVTSMPDHVGATLRHVPYQDQFVIICASY
jgi:hypothetical protein